MVRDGTRGEGGSGRPWFLYIHQSFCTSWSALRNAFMKAWHNTVHGLRTRTARRNSQTRCMHMYAAEAGASGSRGMYVQLHVHVYVHVCMCIIQFSQMIYVTER